MIQLHEALDVRYLGDWLAGSGLRLLLIIIGCLVGARIAWMITIAVSPSTYPTSRMMAAAFGPSIIVNPSPRSQTRIGWR